MTVTEYGKIISKNLKRIAYENQKTQADIARDLGLKQATVSSWMNGTRIPRMSKIDLLCHYFNCTRVDIMEEHPQNIYYITDEAADIAREMYADADMRSLFIMKKNMKKEAFDNYLNFLKTQYLIEHPERGDDFDGC